MQSAETETTENTLLVGKIIQDTLEVTVVPDLLDFSQVRLVKLSLRYADTANGVNERKDFIFRNGAANMTTWTIELEDKNQLEYTWQAMYFMVDGSRKETDAIATTDPTIILEVPAA
ncbi:MAG: hypothetical protein F6K42_21170 [Leptolyngbya sp. SIO1D8]|nr:hypothetical protein [Leptolyngbya sp. SIO1D8]